jgi:NADH-quinone oxidoreductase subunit L
VLPLQVLAVLSLVGGFMGIPHASWIERWLEPVIPAHEAITSGVSGGMEWVLMGLSLAGGVLGIVIGLKLYSNLAKVAELEKRFAFLHKLLENKWYVDEIYEGVFVKPIGALSNFIWKGFDVNVIDRVVVGFGRVSAWTGQTARVIQTGSIQVYAMMLLFGILLSVGYLIYGMA